MSSLIIKEIFQKIKTNDNNENNETYSLQLITTWLKEKNVTFTYSSSAVDMLGLYEHGIRIPLKKYNLSIQTHPTIAGPAFAETLKTNDITSDKRHSKPEDLFNYIEALLKQENEDTEEEKMPSVKEEETEIGIEEDE